MSLLGARFCKWEELYKSNSSQPLLSLGLNFSLAELFLQFFVNESSQAVIVGIYVVAVAVLILSLVFATIGFASFIRFLTVIKKVKKCSKRALKFRLRMLFGQL